MWNKITVGQFQAIHKIAASKDLDETDKVCNYISILYNIDVAQVEELPIHRFNELSKATAAVIAVPEIPGKPQKFIKANGRKYRIVYDASRLKFRQFVEAETWKYNTIENIHMIMASLVRPVNFWGREKANDASDHKRISEDMLMAPITTVYHSCVFFCNVYVNSIKNISPRIIAAMPEHREKIHQSLLDSINALAGYIPLKKLRNLKV